MKKIKIGIGQLHVEGGHPEINLKNAVAFITDAARQKCDIIVLPECLDFGWTNSIALSVSLPVPGAFSELLCDAAKANAIYVIAGLTERAEDKIYNTAVLISDKGVILGKHRKINILDIARHIYMPGNSCSVIATRCGKIGLNICADNAPATNELGHALALMGADIILSPCSWAVPPDFDQNKTPYGDIWKQSYSEIARRHHIPVVGVSNTGLVKDGAWKGWWCIGASLVVSKDGNIQKQFDYTREASTLYSIEVELREK
ncbi:MAG: carbon-nitrogen hydrolase family protein [Saprospiraceae bacterium]|nr:carbon-nitrogen hydrolase family protein [Saprospiraceae bacterium]